MHVYPSIYNQNRTSSIINVISLHLLFKSLDQTEKIIIWEHLPSEGLQRKAVININWWTMTNFEYQWSDKHVVIPSKASKAYDSKKTCPLSQYCIGGNAHAYEHLSQHNYHHWNDTWAGQSWVPPYNSEHRYKWICCMKTWINHIV